MAFMDKAKDLAKAASDKGKNELEVAKLKQKISSEEKAVTIAKEKIGEQYYNLAKQNEIELTDEAKKLSDEIDEHLKAIEDMNESVRLLRDN